MRSEDRAEAARDMAAIMRREALQAIKESEAQRARTQVMRKRNRLLRARVAARFPDFFH